MSSDECDVIIAAVMMTTITHPVSDKFCSFRGRGTYLCLLTHIQYLAESLKNTKNTFEYTLITITRMKRRKQ